MQQAPAGHLCDSLMGKFGKSLEDATKSQGPNSIEKKSTDKSTENPLEFPIEIPYT